MHKRSNGILLIIMFAFAALIFEMTGSEGVAQRNISTEATKQLVTQLEANVDRFERSLDAALDRGRLNGTELEDRINAQVSELESSTDRLENVDAGAIGSDVTAVLGDALRIETFLLANRLTPKVQRDWRQVKGVLDELARAYNVRWVWSAKQFPPLTEEARRRVIDRLETRADEFRESFNDALDQSRADGKPIEDHMNDVVATFERSLDDLEDRANRREEVNEKNVLIVLNNALAIEDYMRKYNMTPRSRLDWMRVRTHLDDLAGIYNVAWTWVGKPGTGGITATDAVKPQ